MTEPFDPTMSPGTPGGRPNVACPGCAYAPTPFDRWMCAPDGCGHMWDTFETRAKCPECGAVFPWTACPGCSKTYPHAAWYRRSA
jgi:hypothetical protein